MTALRRSIAPRVVALALAATALSACGAQAEEVSLGADAAAIADLAVEEGELVVYSAATEEVNAALVEAFNTEHPDVEVTVTKLSSGDLRSRFASETGSGATSADAVIATDPLMFEADPDWFVSLDAETVPNVDSVLDGYVEDNYFGVVTSPWVVTFNTDKVKAGPTTWEELADARYAGVTSFADPDVATDSVLSFYQILGEEYGEDFLGTLGAQNSDWFESSVPAVQKVAAGQTALSAPGARAHSLALIASGAPLEVVTPTPVVAFTNNFAVAAGAEHPNAAALFADFLLSPQGQGAFCGDDLYMSLVDGVDGCVTTPADALVADPLRAGEDREEILASFARD